MKLTLKKQNKTIKPTGNRIIGIVAIAGVAVAIVAGFQIAKMSGRDTNTGRHEFKDTNFGDFLALNHALYADDYASVEKYSDKLKDVDIKSVRENRALALFVAGKIDDTAKVLSDSKNASASVAYAAYLIKKGDWNALYLRYATNNSQILAGLRVWSAVAIGKSAEALKFIDSLPGNDSWRAFMRGQIYAEIGKPDLARQQFAKVAPDFLNLNDYLFIMSFYTSNGFDADANQLKAAWTESPGGLYAAGWTDFGDFKHYAGPGMNLWFSLVQSVAHSPILSHSNISFVLLRLAEAAGGDAVKDNDAMNYYFGSFFFNSGDFDRADEFFAQIGRGGLYRPFVLLKNAEKTGNFEKTMRELNAANLENPLFMPAILELTNKNLQKGREKDALAVVNRAMAAPNLGNLGRAFLYTLRARIYRQSGDFNAALADILSADTLSPQNADVAMERARILAESGQDLDTAYQIATIILKRTPSDIGAWDTLATIVWKKEGVNEALPIFEKIARVAESDSKLFEHLGDARAATGDAKGAVEAYQRALSLSDDGQVSEPDILKKNSSAEIKMNK